MNSGFFLPKASTTEPLVNGIIIGSDNSLSPIGAKLFSESVVTQIAFKFWPFGRIQFTSDKDYLLM